MRKSSRLIFESRLFRLGEFHLLPGNPRWRTENCIGPAAHVVFPGTAVRITHAGCRALIADANQVVFYREGESYRRELVDPRGDHCVFVVPAPLLLAEAIAAAGGDGLSFTHGPADAATYLRQRVVAHHAVHSPDPDPLLVEEELTRAIAAAVEAAVRANGVAPPGPAAGEAAVDAARASLAARYAERLSLDGLAREVHVSPFHLAHRFRARTGTGLHAYRTQLRLREALRRIAEPETSLTDLALDLGFASHSHFTDTFRRTFGRPPSAVRSAVRSRGSAEARRILEATPALRS
ncbi:MAG: helix-turn-helix transcriptional regulator [Gaiellales bacterium]